MKCSHKGHPSHPPPPPHRLLQFLTQGNWTPSKFSLLHNLVELSLPREDYHLSLTTREGYPRKDNHLSLATLGDCYPLISPTITLVNYQPRHKVTCRPVLEYLIPYPFSPQLFWFSCLLS